MAIDGGTYQGLAALLVIQNIVELASKKARKQLFPSDIFDMISGTSSGGLVAILLGRLGLDCATAISLYKELTGKLFGADEIEFWAQVLEHRPFKHDAFKSTLRLAMNQYSNASTAMVGWNVYNRSSRVSLPIIHARPNIVNDGILGLAGGNVRCTRLSKPNVSHPKLCCTT